MSRTIGRRTMGCEPATVELYHRQNHHLTLAPEGASERPKHCQVFLFWYNCTVRYSTSTVWCQVWGIQYKCVQIAPTWTQVKTGPIVFSWGVLYPIVCKVLKYKYEHILSCRRSRKRFLKESISIWVPHHIFVELYNLSEGTKTEISWVTVRRSTMFHTATFL